MELSQEQTTKQNKRDIFLFYKSTSLLYIQVKSANMIKWERDLQKEFTLPQWRLIIQYNSRSSACIDHWDNTQKLLHRWYLAPLRISKMDPNTSPMCWRDCSSTGNLLHILWSCVVIRPFLDKGYNLFPKTTGYRCALTPSLALLSLGIE